MKISDFLNEIDMGDMDDTFIDDLDQKDLSSDQLDLFGPVSPHVPRLPPNYKMVGKLDEFHVCEKTDFSDKRYRAFVFIRDGQAASFMYLHIWHMDFLQYRGENTYKPYLNGKGLRVSSVYVREDFRGQKLAVRMYEWILQNNICDYIIADSTHTSGGVALWKQLQRRKTLAVEVWDGNQGLSRRRRPGKDFNQVYKTYSLIPWVTLKSKLDFVLYGFD